jgi:hypothetical protein
MDLIPFGRRFHARRVLSLYLLASGLGVGAAWLVGAVTATRAAGWFITLAGWAVALTAFGSGGWFPFERKSPRFYRWVRGRGDGSDGRLAGPMVEFLLFVGGVLMAALGHILLALAP